MPSPRRITPSSSGSAGRSASAQSPAWSQPGAARAADCQSPSGLWAAMQKSPQARFDNGDVRLGIADHLGWAVAVTASAGHEVVDRRRIELVEPGTSPAPIHYESARLDVAATAALVAQVRASVVRAASAELEEI